MNAPMIGGEPDALKGACPVWEGLQQDCFLRKEYGVLILLHRIPVLVMVAVVVAALMPGIAAAQPTQSEIQLRRHATLVGDTLDQIIVEFTYRCFGGTGSVFASASQSQPFTSVTGFGSASVTCDGQQRRDGVTVSTSPFPGWQAGPATAAVTLLAGSGTAADSGPITIVAP